MRNPFLGYPFLFTTELNYSTTLPKLPLARLQDPKSQDKIRGRMRDNRRAKPAPPVERTVGNAADRGNKPTVMFNREQGDHPPESRKGNKPPAEEQFLRNGNDERAPDQPDRDHRRARLSHGLRTALADDAEPAVERDVELFGQNPDQEDGETDEQAGQEGGL